VTDVEVGSTSGDELVVDGDSASSSAGARKGRGRGGWWGGKMCGDIHLHGLDLGMIDGWMEVDPET